MLAPAAGEAGKPGQNTYRLSIAPITAAVFIHILILTGLTWLFCWGLAAYTMRKETDALFALSFCYGLLGLTTWAGRVLRFYNQSGHFSGEFRVTRNDRADLPIAQRRWLLIVYENRFLLPWVIAALIVLAAAFVLGMILKPDIVLPFLVRPDLPPQIRPD